MCQCRIVLIKRPRVCPLLLRWLQPGGHVEPHDADLLAAARREVAEEVGLFDLPLAVQAAFDLDVHRIPALGREPAHEHFDVRFLFRAQDRELRASEHGTETARWFALHELEAEGSDRSVQRAARKLRAG